MFPNSGIFPPTGDFHPRLLRSVGPTGPPQTKILGHILPHRRLFSYLVEITGFLSGLTSRLLSVYSNRVDHLTIAAWDSRAILWDFFSSKILSEASPPDRFSFSGCNISGGYFIFVRSIYIE